MARPNGSRKVRKWIITPKVAESAGVSLTKELSKEDMEKLLAARRDVKSQDAGKLPEEVSDAAIAEIKSHFRTENGVTRQTRAKNLGAYSKNIVGLSDIPKERRKEWKSLVGKIKEGSKLSSEEKNKVAKLYLDAKSKTRKEYTEALRNVKSRQSLALKESLKRVGDSSRYTGSSISKAKIEKGQSLARAIAGKSYKFINHSSVTPYFGKNLRVLELRGNIDGHFRFEVYNSKMGFTDLRGDHLLRMIENGTLSEVGKLS